MKKYLLALSLLWFYNAAHSQTKFVTDHKYHLHKLSNSKDSLYNGILKEYDIAIAQNPENYKPALEKCKFIENAYYDSYEDYNPNYDIAQACADSLHLLFPDTPEVLLYPTNFIYGDSLELYLTLLEDKIDSNTDLWQSYRWEVYRQLAQFYQGDESKNNLIIKYGELAQEHNDTLDISPMLAEAYEQADERGKAIDVLLLHIDSTDNVWDLNQKATLLLELGSPDHALETFKMAGKKSAAAEDAGKIAKALIENGLVSEAREFLLKDVENGSWNVAQKLKSLLEYDLKHGLPDSAALSYHKFTAENFYNDPLGIYRLRLVMKNPFAGWSWADGGRLLLLIFLIIVPFVLPYLWILPIHYLGTYYRQKGTVFEEGTFNWGLRHFWIASSLWLSCELLSSLLFDYDGIITYFNNDYLLDEMPAMSKNLANLNIFFFSNSAIFSIAMLRSDDIAEFFPKLKANLNSVGVGIALAIMLKIGTALYVSVLSGLGVDFTTNASVICSINDTIMSINKFYNPLLGFLFVVILVPFYEEVLFRGIFLSSCQRNMKFMIANIFQSTIFALVHQDLKFFVFYFAFGMVAGHFTRKSGSLITSTSMHMMNNGMAFTYLLTMHDKV